MIEYWTGVSATMRPLFDSHPKDTEKDRANRSSSFSKVPSLFGLKRIQSTNGSAAGHRDAQREITEFDWPVRAHSDTHTVLDTDRSNVPKAISIGIATKPDHIV